VTTEDLGTLTFEQLLERLEGITRRMAAGDIGIEAVTDLYEEAGRLHTEATERLERVRRRLEAETAEREAGA
jgi:exodeoxyribonuclease VII small subunit